MHVRHTVNSDKVHIARVMRARVHNPFSDLTRDVYSYRRHADDGKLLLFISVPLRGAAGIRHFSLSL